MRVRFWARTSRRVLAVALALFAGGANAQDYPTRPVRLIVAFTPGGTTEVFRTIIAQHDLGLPRPDYPGRKAFLTGERSSSSAA